MGGQGPVLPRHSLITFEFSENVVAWVGRQLQEDFRPPAVGIGVLVDGVPACGVVYYEVEYDSTGKVHNVWVAIASVNKKWASRKSLSVLFGYPFKQLKAKRLTAIVAKKNKKSRSMVERMGFQLEGVSRCGFENDDACIYGILDTEAEKWIDGQEKLAEPAGRA